MSEENIDSFRRFVDALTRGDFRVDFPDLRDLGDGRVLAIGTLHIRGKGSGIEADVPTAGIATYREGRLFHWKDFGQKEKTLEAAGLGDP